MDRDEPIFRPSGAFPTTAWSLVAAAKDPQRVGHVAAVNLLASKYWKPIFYFIRAKGYASNVAEDLTQEFFLRFLERDWIQRVDPTRGRFRTFVLTILSRFLADESAARVRKQKRFEREILSISRLVTDEDRDFEPAVSESPEAIFIRQWALTTVHNTRENVRRECIAEGREAWYDLFEASVMPESGQRSSQPVLAQRFGLSRDQVRYRLEQVRKRFDRSFRTELRSDGCSEEDLSRELHGLMNLL